MYFLALFDHELSLFVAGGWKFNQKKILTGTVFDNIMITDNLAAARRFAEENWGLGREAGHDLFFPSYNTI